MKKIFIAIVAIGTFATIIGFFNNVESKNTENEDIPKKNKQWRTPNGDEYALFGKLIISNGLKGCGLYYIKETTYGEYLLACSSDDVNWNYFISWPQINKLMEVDDETKHRIIPPELN